MKDTKNADSFWVKCRKAGDKAYKFVGSNGRITHLRVHAVEFPSQERADTVAKELSEGNPGYEFVIRTRRVKRAATAIACAALLFAATTPAHAGRWHRYGYWHHGMSVGSAMALGLGLGMLLAAPRAYQFPAPVYAPPRPVYYPPAYYPRPYYAVPSVRFWGYWP